MTSRAGRADRMDIVDDYECIICNDTLKDCVMTKCGHSFCDVCIQGWIKTNNSCPNCHTPYPYPKPNPNYIVRGLVELAAKRAADAAQEALTPPVPSIVRAAP